MRMIHFCGLLLVASALQAQTLKQTASPANPLPISYVIGQQGANSRVWQKVVRSVDTQGNTVYQTNQAYVELATGLDHLVNGQWAASKEEIDISPDGSSAAATNGQHQVYFPGNVYNGMIKLVTPDGKVLQSQPIGLSYSDGSNSVLLAVVTNSTGAILPSGDQVIYTKAFAGLNADLLYIYTKAGMEQDVVLHEQPPDPSSLGLDPTRTRLQVLTEFIASPQPNVTATTVPTDAGNLEDDNLGFGAMQMGRGKAFLIGGNSPSAGVEKRWLTLNRRQFLIEEVPIVSIADAIDTLPPFVAGRNGSPGRPRPGEFCELPPPRLVHATPKTRFLAQAAPLNRGLVLDYVTISSQVNCTFRGDTTYYISGAVSLTGTNTFEGGTVIKYTNGASLTLTVSSTPLVINWLGSTYRPVVFTAKDDNSVGEGISGSTGKPTNYYAKTALTLIAPSVTPTISNFRIAYATQALALIGTSPSLYNGQFVDCQNGITTSGSSSGVRNMLFANVLTNFSNLQGGTLQAQNVTFSGSLYLETAPSFGSGANFTNCIFANITNLTNNASMDFGGTHNGFCNCPEFGSGAVTNLFYPFQAVGGGNYYLTNGCNFINAGTSNIDPTLLVDLRQKTTYPPSIYSNQTISLSSTLSPQAERDTDTLDLGYHYDPIDYIVDYFAITNAALILTNGVVVASYNETGVWLLDGSVMVSIGTPLQPNWLVRYQSVQEQPVALGINGYGPGGGIDVSPYYNNVMPIGQFRFTKFACPAGGGDHLYDSANSSYSTLAVQDCEFWGGTNYFSGTNGSTTTLKNSLFARSAINASGNGFLSFSNNLAWGAASVQLNPSGSSVWNAYNNDFDSSTISSTNLTNGYNAYLNCNGRLYPTNANDIVSSNSVAYQTGPLGTFYQPTNSSLIHQGSTTADQAGLHDYTVTTNEIIEGTNIVSLGYHYVALDTNGTPFDTYWIGIPDYLADANGSLEAWLLKYFGYLGVDPYADYDSDGTDNLQEYLNGTDPNKISFFFSVPIQYVTTNIINGFITIWGGVPSYYAVIVDNTNFSAAAWTNYTSSEISINLGTNWGPHDVWVGLRGLPPDAQQTWQKDQLFVARPMVKAGWSHNVALNPDGTVWAWGAGDNGELGNFQWIGSTNPVQVVGLSNIVAIAVEDESSFTLALDSGGAVWSWGANRYGQLGRNDRLFADENSAAPVPGLSNIEAIAVGYAHSIALRNDGTVWAWGDDPHGELGDGTNVYRDYPEPVPGLTNVVQIASGAGFSFAVCSNGTVWGWGYNADGELGIGNTGNQSVPVQVTALSNIVALSGGFDHSLAVRTDGTLLAWGYGRNGQLGNGASTNSLTAVTVSGLSNITTIACGEDHCLALNRNGSLYTWGADGVGQLGDGSQNDTNFPSLVTSVSNIIAIAGGAETSLAYTTSGKIYEWGEELWGSETDYLQPREIDLPEVPVNDASNITAFFQNPFVNTNVVPASVSGGPAVSMAILVNSTDFAAAQWFPFSENPLVHLGTTDGTYQVWFGFQGFNGTDYWSMATVTLDRTPPTVAITAPANNASFNLSSINVQGNFSDANFKQLTVNGVLAFTNGANFNALNVPLNAGVNVITAVAEDLAGNLGSNSVTVIGLTNSDGTMNDPIQLQATPTVGFTPLTVTFQIISNSAPGTFVQALYDFNGDGITDLATNNLSPLAYTYRTNGEYFPVVTIQTTTGTFSSSGGWNSTDANRLRIVVQHQATQISSFSVTDPVDVKWVPPTNLYVLSGSTATITEYDTNGNTIRSLSSLGSNPSGFDLDTNGNVYVAVTGSNQVWKFNPTTSSFATDTNFGFGGFIGATNGTTGTTNGQFNSPFDVAVSPDGGTISISDSGNDRIQQFDTKGNFVNSFGTNGADIGQFNSPKGLSYDSSGTLYVVDNGNSRIVLVLGSSIERVTGTNGTAFGQFSNLVNIAFGEHGAYLADTGNNRIQSFSLPAVHSLFSADSSAIRFVVSTNFNQPAAVAAMDDDLTTEKFWVADTANNLVRLFAIAPENVMTSWTNMTVHISSGDIEGALANFSVASVDDYRDLFLATGISSTISTISQIGALSPVYIDDDRAEYYFTQTINGQVIGFPVEFVKENGVWKILEF